MAVQSTHISDEHFMRQALALAAQGRGYASPNPLVGCVIVDKDGKVIGTGYHEKFGEAHAEVNAIRDAEKNGHKVAGTTLYVNLEPCSHQAKTPPCADLIIAKKLGRCVIAMRDPHSLVDGKGIDKLKAAGIDVTHGVLEAEARELNRIFITFVTKATPYVTMKLGMSLDGKTALRSGVSKWITSEASRTAVHAMRAEYDGVLVASATVLADDPELTVRLVKGRSPKRIILDANLRVPESAKVYSDAHAAQTIVVATERTLAEKTELRTMLASRGITFISATASDNQFVLKDVFAKLGAMDISSVLVEPGPTLATVLLQENLFDELVLFVAPMVLGNDARSAFADLHLKKLQDAGRLTLNACQAIEGSDDVRITYRAASKN
ncbi:MAG: bifunctional diaminohydroxyphosphoribosylaminopyrimidine deaminase/5-amino-6-(5-phosphoribosylamino)uracil reductase RibD [Bacteroidota bacterium]|nr:bifunctional diaminohydroxyphosphoribosylaminopyrimidine deaminase/5-amino-6-(5-phosphoribosylamino)uracil reductase RibD [Bacteroidota bacterium]MDP4236617.1 bifunctional diaminohydroxyphosphoribosylaminopyrimidine deaminase/5-amino-6-(5-phosphoribosylamino)uracil reductase RibD [Bacteroidota bacterium]